MQAEVSILFVDSVSDLVVKRVVAANRLRNSPVGITTYRKNRERWAVALKLKGRTVYTVSGKAVTADRLHPVILPKGCDYFWKCMEPGECFFIEFEAEGELTEFDSFEIADCDPIVTAFSKIEKSLSAKKPYYKQECNYYLYEILCFLLKSAKKEPTHPKNLEVLRPAERYILENYFDSAITNDFLAGLCGISTVYFRKCFENTYGVSPIRYLHNFRIGKAKAILRSDYDSVEQVALSVGYNSIYHFSKMFRMYTGQSPSEYAKAAR